MTPKLLRRFVSAARLLPVIAACALAAAGDADAKCMSSNVSALPEMATRLPTNGRIVLEGYGGAQALVDGLGTRRPVLAAAGDVVPLRVTSRFAGEMAVKQVVLVPERTLKPNTKYELRLLAPGDPLPQVWNGSARVTMAWTTAAGPDTTSPT